LHKDKHPDQKSGFGAFLTIRHQQAEKRTAFSEYFLIFVPLKKYVE